MCMMITSRCFVLRTQKQKKISFVWCSNKLKSHHHTIAVASPPRKISMLKSTPLYPSFVTGFADAEGCFMISIFKRTFPSPPEGGRLGII